MKAVGGGVGEKKNANGGKKKHERPMRPEKMKNEADTKLDSFFLGSVCLK